MGVERAFVRRFLYRCQFSVGRARGVRCIAARKRLPASVMVERIVYFLGAGFSAPLGIPVMSNFLERSKDQYFRDPKTYAGFKHIFKRIRAMADVKNYYSSNQFNIEEILSLLEMHAELGKDTELRDQFVDYLQQVVSFYTPLIQEYPDASAVPGNWVDGLFAVDEPNRLYAAFVACLHEAVIYETKVRYEDSRGARMLRRWVTMRRPDTPQRYAVISLNYDLLIERMTVHLNRDGSTTLVLTTDLKAVNAETYQGLPLAKLHGSVGGAIVPPTWSKGFHPEMMGAWRLAHRLLAGASHIRILGYSLPDSDAYVRYLLKSAILKTDRLKTIHVLCKEDPEKTVEKRYRDFITFPGFRFEDGDVTDYLNYASVGGRTNYVPPDVADVKEGYGFFHGLEETHNRAFPRKK
jgi:hypothetical protein